MALDGEIPAVLVESSSGARRTSYPHIHNLYYYGVSVGRTTRLSSRVGTGSGVRSKLGYVDVRAGLGGAGRYCGRLWDAPGGVLRAGRGVRVYPGGGGALRPVWRACQQSKQMRTNLVMLAYTRPPCTSHTVNWSSCWISAGVGGVGDSPRVLPAL